MRSLGRRWTRQQATSPVVARLQVLLDDGLVILTVDEVLADSVVCVIENTSEIGERKGVNLPGIVTDLPPMSEKDREDIRFGMEHDIDMVAASFVRNAEGVREIRTYLESCHQQYSPAPAETPLPLIIAKIESTEALDNLHEIIEEADGVMVARGDLGVEVPLEEVALWQKEIVAACVAVGKPVVVATQMLETMQKNPRPTRAEVADVTNAVLDEADAVMLSGESANGKYPVLSVSTQVPSKATVYGKHGRCGENVVRMW
jgi:pyruvate kinase